MNDDELRGLQERVALIKDASEHPGWTMVVDRAIAQINFKQNQMLSGQVETYEKYRELIAWIAGAKFVTEIPKKVEVELEKELQNREEG